MAYIPVIGLEIHAELLTESKVFCDCNAEFGGEHNSRCCPTCTGLPGTLPVINQTAVEYAVKAGFALNCDINKFSVFDRKNYFYPDLPKAYQISQLYYPLCINGNVSIDVGGKSKNIRINRIHLEEDAGKLIHDDWNDVSLADYNRCGVPLIEIVTEPDLASSEEAQAFVEKVRQLLIYAGVTDGKMEQGSLRCDVNVSVMKDTDTEFGTRAEIKNLNSIKSITRSIDYEIKRQIRLVDSGKRVVQETRRFNENRGETSSMRSKEDAHDYRYFPEPDILQVNFTDEMLTEIHKKLPELPYQRIEKYIKKYNLSEKDAKIIVAKKSISDFFESCLALYNSPKSLSNFITGELLRRINLGEIDEDNFKFSAKQFAELVKLSDEEKVSKNDAKTVFRTMVETGEEPLEIAKKSGFLITVDTEKVDNVIQNILQNNPVPTEQYRNGDMKVFGFLMGLCNKELKGAATPKIIKDRLTEILGESKKNANETAENAVEKKITASIMEQPPLELKTSISSQEILKEFSVGDALYAVQYGHSVTFRGCVHKLRSMGGITFIILRTGRYIIQSVYSDECKDSLDGIREGAFVEVTGKIKSEEKAPNNVEITLSQIKIISIPAYEYPLRVSDKKLDVSIETNLDNRSVTLRNPRERAIFKLQEGICGGFREFLISEGFTEIHTPKIVAQGAEGGANIFHIEYFDKPAFLNQSPQFYKQAAVAFFDRVFEIAPVYRAEKHATSRHINEYIGLDFEMGYIDSMYDVMSMETACLRHIFEYLERNYSNELEILEVDMPKIENIPCVTLLQAKEILAEKGSKNKLDLEPEDEVFLCNYAKEKFNSDFIFVTHFPSSKPPFYAMNSREDSRFAYKFDLLFRGLEITSGGQRIHDYNEQVDKIKQQGLNPDDFKSYLESHKYGLPPHGGLGIGLERLLMKLLNLNNIRYASMFPRDINRLLP
jgi:aspartyl-tRNA(Asn)/glutamyl-tRNA(Gln) amidotransferase subunit B